MKLTIQQHLHDIQQRIHHAEQQYGRAIGAVKLLAVSKTHSAEKIRQLFAAGQVAFGENYVQEALSKQAQLNDLALEWHFIGRIQSNKVKLIAERFSWVQTVSSIEIAKKMNSCRPVTLPPLQVCIQVNISGEVTKEGVLPAEVERLAAQISSLPNLCWRGLMCIPAPTNDLHEQHRQFAAMRQLFSMLKVHYPMLDTLSMGMSADLDAAIAEGATMVRVGTAIFGMRK
ncbi:MAG: YggS family pyridoxal phosphate-dependent enzyme [Gammaproteobacteria bacterium]